MILTIIESPWRGDVAKHRAYLLRAIKDSLLRGEAPFASHLMYPDVLREEDMGESARGILTGFAWYKVVERCAVYEDYGISSGMELGINEALRRNVDISFRRLYW